MYKPQLGHVHLKVRDLHRAIDFYTKILNMEVTEKIGEQFAFLSGNSMHHELALQQIGPEAPRPHSGATGLYHVAFEVSDKKSFAEAYRLLSEAGIPVHPIDHRISWAMYFSDPDGNGLEIYVDTRKEKSGRDLWYGESLPLDEMKITNYLSNRV